MGNMELKDTVAMMESDDYKERFRAEYAQTLIRYKKLKATLDNWNAVDKSINPCYSTSNKRLFADQFVAMREYLITLGERAYFEGINLHDIYDAVCNS